MSEYESVIYRKVGGVFVKAGVLPAGTRKCRIDIDGRKGAGIFSGKRAIAIVEEAIATHHTGLSEVYEIVPLMVDDAGLTASRIANLAKAREKKMQKAIGEEE